MQDRLVYSTDGGRVTTCATCGQPYKKCRCGQTVQPSHTNNGVVRVVRDRKHRGGKTVTVISGLSGCGADPDALAQQLKKLCGSGGTLKDGNIEIQGDHCEKVSARLVALGYTVKRAGG